MTSVVTLATPSMNTKIVFSLRLLSLFGPPSSPSPPQPSPASQRKFIHNFFFFHEICTCALSSRSGSPNVRFVHAWTPTWMGDCSCSANHTILISPARPWPPLSPERNRPHAAAAAADDDSSRMRLARREATRSDRRTPALRSGAFAAVAVFLLGMLVSFAAPGAAQEPPANGMKVFSRSQNGSCKAFEVSRKSHRMPIQSVRIKQSFDVVDAACSVSVAHGSVENLKIVLSSYNSNSFEGLGRETRRIVLKDFDKRSEVGGQNMTRAVFADEGEDLVMGEEQVRPPPGGWTRGSPSTTAASVDSSPPLLL